MAIPPARVVVLLPVFLIAPELPTPVPENLTKSVKLWPPETCRVAPDATTASSPLPLAPATPIAPPLVTERMPSLTVVSPLKLFELERVCVPVPTLVIPPAPINKPDIVVLLTAALDNLLKTGLQQQPQGADLVMEVMSPGDENRYRDLVEKRDIYARAGIPEYWIVDPELRTITVLVLDGEAYRVHGEFDASATAASVLLTGFSIAVRDVFAVGNGATM